MNANRIRLPLEAKKYVMKLCKRIQEKAPNNQMAIKMAKDMANTAKQYGTLSHKQIDWLINNARIHKIKLPPELIKLRRNKDGERATPIKKERQRVNDDVELKSLKCLRRIEKLLNERLPAWSSD